MKNVYLCSGLERYQGLVQYKCNALEVAVFACYHRLADVTAWLCGLDRAGWLNERGEGQCVDALRWSEEKLSLNRAQLIAASNSNEVILCVLCL